MRRSLNWSHVNIYIYIYMINFYGRPYKLEGVPKELLSDLLVGVGKNVLAIMFGGCLVLLPVDVAKELRIFATSQCTQNWLASDRDRNSCLRSTERHPRNHDLR